MAVEHRVALVTGANRGIGFETCRQLGRRGLHVVLTARQAAAGEKAAGILRAEGLEVDFRRLDVTDLEGIEACARSIDQDLGRLDVLINNAGIMLDSSKLGESIFQADADLVRRSFEVNVLGAPAGPLPGSTHASSGRR